MLTPEEAARRLDTLRDPRWREKAARRAAGLPDAQRGIAEAVLEAPPENHVFIGHGAYERFRDRKIAAGRELDALPDDQRAAVMNALHPGLGPAFTRWWVDARTRPYQHGWSRKAFRTTARYPGLTAQTRALDLVWLADLAGPYDADPAWLAIWGGHLLAHHGRSVTPGAVGGLLAAAADLGGRAGDETFAVLLDIAGGEHPTGMMGRHVVHALLGSSRREGWEFTGKLLLAAQRQEGLRQVILEAADEGHPGAFDHILSVVLDNKLLRFAAAVRAVGVWLGFGANVAELPQVGDRVRKLAAFRASASERDLALHGDDPWDAYIALCAGGMRDVMATMPEMRELAAAPSPELRAVALRYAHAIWMMPGEEVLAAALGDEDIRVAALAASLLSRSGLELPAVFGDLTRLAERLPAKPRELPVRPAEGTSLGVEQCPLTLSRTQVADRLVDALGQRPADDLLPWLPSMSASGRGAAARKIADSEELTPGLRETLITLLGDRSSHVRSTALKALEKLALTPSEAPAVEALLTRAAADIRRGALTLLASQPAHEAKASAERLAASKDKRQRDAAAELLRETGAADTAEIEDLRVTLPGPRTGPLRPRPAKPGRRFANEAARLIVEAIDEIADEHRNVPVTITSWQGHQEVLFGYVRSLPSPFARSRPRRGTAGNGAAPGMLLGDVFLGWWAERPAALRGGDDGLDALRTYVLAHLTPSSRRNPRYMGAWWDDVMIDLAAAPPGDIRHGVIVQHVTSWLVAEHAHGAVVDECVDAFEASLAAVPDEKLIPPPVGDGWQNYAAGRHHSLPSGDWRAFLHANPWLTLLDALFMSRPELFTPWQMERLHRLMRWVERPRPDAVRLLVDDHLLAIAYRVGAATEGDITEAFLMPGNQLFRQLTRRWRSQAEVEYPDLVPIADRVRDRLIEVELRRGDLPTPTSLTVRNVGSVAGTEIVAALLERLGDTPLMRGWNADWRATAESRDAVLSHLLRVSFPGTAEAGAALKHAAAGKGVPDARLVDLALYAPQWASAVEEALGWPGLADGVLWLHAHTKDTQWTVDAELRESWAAMIAERTPLSSQDLLEGAVDVDWFRQSHRELGEEQWSVLYKAAKNAAGGNGHRRAQLFAEAMLGRAAEADLADRIRGKRNQDAVRALGLVPLPADPDAAKAAAMHRYALLREFERGSKEFGSLRQTSERTAVRIGIENLARTAGYADPRRFIWAVEAAEADDLAGGPVTAEADGVTVTLSVTDEGTPDLTVRRGAKTLRSVPVAVKKNESVAALTDRKTALAKQATRVREALQEAMTAQDEFTDDDLAALTRHPVVAPMLRRLVWVTADGRTLMLGADGPAPAGGPLRIAHPADLVTEGSWVSWQERLFAAETRQSFKQVFRELYVLTAAERETSPVSRRYEGHQVQPRQAMALFGGRGWLASHESGEVSRAFHRHGLVARVQFDLGLFTPAEAGLPAIDGVYFTRPGEYLAQPLGDVPPVVFSEAMRDVDLVVSVAHAGGVDPEATASTIEMRAALVRETARLMKLGCVSFAGSHVLIDGKLGEYSLHLGSGTVHRRPGGALCIVPVSPQHRGRLFLPFADDDPKTAEIVSKVVLLARDHEIKDPTILEQLHG